VRLVLSRGGGGGGGGRDDGVRTATLAACTLGGVGRQALLRLCDAGVRNG
jgi:hypothetical protein